MMTFGTLVFTILALTSGAYGIPDSSNDNDVELTFIYKNKLGSSFGYNDKEQTAGGLDFINKIDVYYDGKTGETFVFLLIDAIAFYIPPGASNQLWVAEKQSFADYLNNGPGTAALVDIGKKNGTQFCPLTITNEQQQKLVKILKTLTPDYNSACRAYQDAVGASVVLGLAHIGDGLGITYDDAEFKSACDYHCTRGRAVGVVDFFAYIKGGIQTAAKHKIHLNKEKLYGVPRGSDTYIYLLEKLNSTINLTKEFQALTDPEEFFGLLYKLNGKVLYGHQGFSVLVWGLLSYANGHYSQDNLKLILKEFFESTRETDEDLRQDWETTIANLRTAGTELGLNDGFPVIVKALKDIINKKWVVNNINLTVAIDVILNTKRPAGLDAVYKVIAALKPSQ